MATPVDDVWEIFKKFMGEVYLHPLKQRKAARDIMARCKPPKDTEKRRDPPPAPEKAK